MNKRILITFIVFSVIMLACSNEELSEKRYVFVKTLELKSSPSSDGEVVAKLTYGDSVTVFSTDKEETIDGVTDKWYNVRAKEQEGYVFGTYILPIMPPDPNMGGYFQYLSTLEPIGNPDTTRTESLVEIDKKMTAGITLKERQVDIGDGGTIFEYHLVAPGLSLQQGFLLAKAITLENLREGDLINIPKVDKDSDGKSMIQEDSDWQIIVVKEMKGGVVIMFPDRAD